MTIFKKSLLTLGFAAFVFLVILVTSVLLFANTFYYEVNSAGLRNTANTIMTVIGEERLTEIFLNGSNTDADLPVSAGGPFRLTLIAPSGYVLWDSHVKTEMFNHIDRAEIIAALEGRTEGALRDSFSARVRQTYYAMPVFHNGNVIGVFRLSYTIPGFGLRISPIIPSFLAFSLIMALAIFCGIYVFSRFISISVGRLVNIAQAGTSLLSGIEANISVAPEFQSLEKAIRAMTQELTFRLEQAKAEGHRLEAILNGMAEAVFAMDSSLKLHLVNPKARELFNIEGNEINTSNTSVKTLSLLEATRSTELVDAAKKALFSNSSLETELSFHAGTEKHFLVYAAPLPAPLPPLSLVPKNTNAAGVVIVLQEITRLVKLERIRKDFVANVSHELRTPIQLIKGFSETLLDTIKEDSKGNKKQIAHFSEIILKNAGIMENLTNDLLILADLENSAGVVRNREMESLNVSSIIEEAVSAVHMQAKRKDIKINVNCPEKLKANLYGSMMIQALINLIDNGIKYSSSKSKLWVNAYTEDSHLIMEVKDKGIGIPAEHQERIFERFYRVDRARSRDAGGTGLGLSIVRHIALLHKGNAEVESHAGHGSTFRIKIPQ
jgi:two-component system phosphate regulon sensor histidine kinase PhoR